MFWNTYREAEMKKFGVGFLVVAVVLSVVAVVGSQVDRVSASGSAQEEEAGPPYIGVVVRTIDEARAGELGIDGGVEVVHVQEDGPSTGLLADGDVITAADGASIATAKDLVEAVKAKSPGDVITLAVDGRGDVEVTVGERDILDFKARGFKFHGGLGKLSDDLVRSERVTKTDDGTKTVRTVVGPLVAVDANAGTLTISQRDDSGDVTYAISDETKISVDREEVGLDGLIIGETTNVVTVTENDGPEVVKSVSQGHGTCSVGGVAPHVGRSFFQFRSGQRSFGSESLFRIAPFDEGRLSELRERLEGLDFGPEFRERLDRLIPRIEGYLERAESSEF